ncbi:di-trans,poly-cis-decaprenylcistransferase [Candidatus Saccharibacteria bacterium]|nr:di-trans,poly-cis-decaprenylcistransferase [Candidatus Saccharibacteria bacterium]
MQNNNVHVVPNHLGLILDGNRRWARDQGLPTLEGHRKGYENLKDIARYAFDKGVKYVSAYIFSTENWDRTKEEVDYLMSLAMTIAVKDSKKLIKENIKIVVLGVDDKVPPKLIEAWRSAEADSKENTGGVLALCFNYGGTREISDAIKRMIADGVEPGDVDDAKISSYLYHPEVPDVDFMIRTSGEQRISNFMLWRMKYAELYFEQKHWPAFGVKELEVAFEEFANRNRRFGGN